VAQLFGLGMYVQVESAKSVYHEVRSNYRHSLKGCAVPDSDSSAFTKEAEFQSMNTIIRL